TLRWTDGLVACATDDDKYILTSPNVAYIPRPAYGYVKVVRQWDGHFGWHDPIRWPQVFIDHPRYRWLCAVSRRPHGDQDYRLPIWKPLALADVSPIEDGFVASFGTVSPAFRRALRPVVSAMSRRAGDFTRQCGKQSEFLALVTCMTEAFERLDFPSTHRDLVRQLASVQRFWLLADAWLEFHVYLNPSYSFRERPDRPRPALRHDVMGAFTTEPQIAQRLFSMGIPLWFMRLERQLTSNVVVLRTVVFAEPPTVLDHGLFLSEPVYNGFAGVQHIQAISSQAHVYADVEVAPLPAVSSSPAAASPAPTQPPREGSSADDVLPLSRASASSQAGPSTSSHRYHPYIDQASTGTAKTMSGKKKAKPRTRPQAPKPNESHRVPKVPDGHRDKFAPFVHERLPPTLEPWQNALSAVDRSRSAPVRDAWNYFLPDPQIIAHSNDDR
ncbi:hypothetical protein EIP86_000004, partial [Pleurotus ostreatoroseus]